MKNLLILLIALLFLNGCSKVTDKVVNPSLPKTMVISDNIIVNKINSDTLTVVGNNASEPTTNVVIGFIFPSESLYGHTKWVTFKSLSADFTGSFATTINNSTIELIDSLYISFKVVDKDIAIINKPF